MNSGVTRGLSQGENLTEGESLSSVGGPQANTQNKS